MFFANHFFVHYVLPWFHVHFWSLDFSWMGSRMLMELVWKIKVFHVYFSQFQLVLATVAQKRKQLQASVTQCLREFPRNAKIPAGELYLESIYCFSFGY